MRNLLLLLLSTTLFFNVACSKKGSSSTAATAPVTTPTTTVPPTTVLPSGYIIIPNLPVATYGSFYYGQVNMTNLAVYSYFLKSAFGYQAYNNGGYYGSNTGYGYNYNYSCDINIYRWIFGGNVADCGSSQSQFDQYLNTLTYQTAIVQFAFRNDGTVQGLWLAGGTVDLQGNFYAYEQIPFQGRLTMTADGHYQITAGPLVFVTTALASNFDVYFNNLPFGNVTIR
ncbi:MAG: hypothetical protein H6623_09760 [Bdellovibrionaceae bacterium]|nr:hypothetical protein [Pseudobdellovibrionaceae bacterium]